MLETNWIKYQNNLYRENKRHMADIKLLCANRNYNCNKYQQISILTLNILLSLQRTYFY